MTGPFVTIRDAAPPTKGVRPTDSVGILQEVDSRMAAYVGRPMSAKQFRLTFVREMSCVLARQSEVRMMPSFEVEKFALEAVAIESPSVPGHFSWAVPHDWMERLDAALFNRRCGRCRGLVVPGISHGPDRCDEELVRGIVES